MIKNNERLAVVESKLEDLKEENTEEHKEIKESQLRTEKKIDRTNDKLDGIGQKLSSALSGKADKSELRRLDTRIWGVAATVGLTIIGYIIKTFFVE